MPKQEDEDLILLNSLLEGVRESERRRPLSQRLKSLREASETIAEVFDANHTAPHILGLNYKFRILGRQRPVDTTDLIAHAFGFNLSPNASRRARLSEDSHTEMLKPKV